MQRLRRIPHFNFFLIVIKSRNYFHNTSYITNDNNDDDNNDSNDYDNDNKSDRFSSLSLIPTS